MKRSFGKSFFVILTLLTLLTLTFSILGTTTAYADDATPPPATEEPIPPVDESAGNADDVVDTTAESDDSAISAESQNCIPQPTDGEVQTEGSEAVVLCVPEDVIAENQSDNPEISNSESLASETDAETLFSGDPMWCPAGVLPGNPGCTASFFSFNGAGGLINALETGSYAGAGTIYVSWDYNVSEWIDIDYGDVDLTDLVFQGGWDFMFNKVVGETTFRREISFHDWGGYNTPGSLTINDININTLSSDGLYIGDLNDTTTANVTLNNVSVSNQDGGALIETNGSVTVNNSEFKNNFGDGLDIFADGNIILNNVTASNNTYDGVYITGNNNLYTGSVSVNGGTFTNNGNGTYNSAYGLNIYACQLNLNGAQSLGGNQSGDVFFDQNPSCINGNNEDSKKDKKKSKSTTSSNTLCADSKLTAGDIKGTLHNLCGISILMKSIVKDDLPGEMPSDTTFQTGVEISAIGLPAGSYVELSFPTPEDVDIANLAVLFWNDTEWVEAPGGEVVDGFLVVKVAKPGIYVLSSK